MKRCSLCGLVKPLSDFHLDRRVSDGHKAKCKGCQNRAYRQWRARTETFAPRRCGDERRRVIKPGTRRRSARDASCNGP